MKALPSLSFLVFLLLAVPFSLFAQDEEARETPEEPVTQRLDGSYILTEQDLISVVVFDEPDLSVSQRIDADGQLRLPLIGTVKISEMTIRLAEEHIERLYYEERILRDPMVTIRVAEYSPKEINILGAIGRPGKMAFPPEVNRMDIVDVIARSGGFSSIAKSHEVRVTRRFDDGEERTFTVNVERMIKGSSHDQDKFYVLPGDNIWIGEKIW